LFHNLLQADVVLISPEARDLQNAGTIPRARLYQAQSEIGIQSGSPMYIGFLDWRAPITNHRWSMMVICTDPDDPGVLLGNLQEEKEILKQPDTVLFDRLARETTSRRCRCLTEVYQ